MSIEDNKALVRRWMAARNICDLAAALTCWAGETHHWLTPAFKRFTAGKIAGLVRAADNLVWLKQLGVRAMWEDKAIE